MTSRVPRTRRIALVGLSVATLVGAAALSGVVATSAQAVPDYRNMITLETGATSIVRLYDANGEVTSSDSKKPMPQTLSSTSSNNCTLKSENAILAFTGTKAAGLRQGSIGVVDKLSGESCSQVDAERSEALNINLVGKAALSAVLDIEAIKNVVIKATVSMTGVTGTRDFFLYSGTADTTDAPVGYFPCNPGSTSSAPNSGPSDNCKWPISDGAPFDKLVLQATGAGQFSLEGGGDWPGGSGASNGAVPANATYFSLAVLCDASKVITFSGGEANADFPSGSVKRYANADGSTCFDDSLTATPGVDDEGYKVDIIKQGQPYAQYLVNVDWKKEPGTPAVSQTTIQFSIGPDPDDLSQEEILPWCPTSLFETASSVDADGNAATSGRVLTKVADVSGSASGIADELAGLGITNMAGPDSPSVQFSCIQERNAKYVAGEFVVSDLIYVIGDLRFRS